MISHIQFGVDQDRNQREGRIVDVEHFLSELFGNIQELSRSHLSDEGKPQKVLVVEERKSAQSIIRKIMPPAIWSARFMVTARRYAMHWMDLTMR